MTPALEAVCVAFAGPQWKELLFYAANNVELHSHHRSTTRGNATSEVELWRDKVHESVLKKSVFVRNLVARFNELVQFNDRQARRSRRRLLSEICLDFPLRVVRTLGFKLPMLPRHKRTAPTPSRTITKNMYTAARNHARAFGPGGIGFEIPHVRRATISVAKISEIMDFLNHELRIQQLAVGTKPLVLSTGEIIEIPSVTRKMLRSHLWSLHVKENTDDDGRYVGNFKKKQFFEVVGTATGDIRGSGSN